MSRTTCLRLLALGAGLLGLAACSSNANDFKLRDVLGQLQQIGKSQPAPTRITQEQIAAVLAATDKPVILIESEALSAQSFMIEIERNKGHASFATQARQVVVIKDGMITATRGLGGDLMSSDIDSLLAAVRNGSAGSAPYEMRFLTPEDVTQRYDLTCALSRAGDTVTAECSGDGVAFTNRYSIGNYGSIVASRQWLGPTLGYLKFGYLRG